MLGPHADVKEHNSTPTRGHLVSSGSSLVGSMLLLLLRLCSFYGGEEHPTATEGWSNDDHRSAVRTYLPPSGAPRRGLCRCGTTLVDRAGDGVDGPARDGRHAWDGIHRQAYTTSKLAIGGR